MKPVGTLMRPTRPPPPPPAAHPLLPVRPGSAAPKVSVPVTAVKPAPVVKPVVPVIPGLKRALLIGVNYIGSQYELAGCINDVLNVQSHLGKFFPSCKDIKLLSDTSSIKPTKTNVLDSIKWLVTGLRPGENVLFHYSGHGGLVRDKNGDEVSGYDSTIYPYNGTDLEEITDDELRSLLANNIPAGCKCFVVLDCCHSGTAVDLRYRLDVSAPNRIYYEENKRYSKTAGQVLFLSGCRDVQVAADTVNKDNVPCGALTWALLETWKKYGRAIKPKYLLWDVLEFLRVRGYDQKPQLSMGQYLDFNTVFDLGV